MREYLYISPSALAKWESNRIEFYKRYLCPIRTPRPPQADFMGTGSGFDAIVKSNIYDVVNGRSKGTPFDFETLFEKQVEPHNRDESLKRATDLWNQYNESGSYGHLLADIVASPYPIQMEFDVKGEVEGVPMFGKPDLRYVTKSEIHVICDWKVNGSHSRIGASPHQGYKICWDYGSRTHGKPHNKFIPQQFKDMIISGRYLNEYCPDWADQLSIYSWLLGEPVGGDSFVIRMEQVACRPVKKRPLPRAKFATHLARVEPDYQRSLMQRIQSCWACIQSGHIFTDLSREKSDEKIEMLNRQAETPRGLHPGLEAYYDSQTRFK